MTDYWVAKPHQVTISSEALPILEKNGLVYLAMEERTGKSIIAIRLCEFFKNVNKVLILTTGKALPGWVETLKKYQHDKIYTVNTYSSAHKIAGKFDIVILDEAHKYISGYPKPSKTWDYVYKLVYGLPIVYCSATPHAQGPQLMYHQLALSYKNPWKEYKNFYTWFKKYAIKVNGELPTTKISPTQTVIDYKKVDSKVLDSIAYLFVSYTRKELGFTHEPEDVLHFIELTKNTKSIYNYLIDKKVLDFTSSYNGKDYKLVCDSATKLRFALHMLEGGTLKVEDDYIDLGFNEKVEYILNTWGDSSDVAIMYFYKADAIKLEKNFKNAGLFQASSYAEGVDLSHYKHLIIYSQDHSTSRHSQRRARQANIDRKEEIKVHFLLVKGAISHRVYKTVSKNKQNFVDTVFERI